MQNKMLLFFLLFLGWEDSCDSSFIKYTLIKNQDMSNDGFVSGFGFVRFCWMFMIMLESEHEDYESWVLSCTTHIPLFPQGFICRKCVCAWLCVCVHISVLNHTFIWVDGVFIFICYRNIRASVIRLVPVLYSLPTYIFCHLFKCIFNVSLFLRIY